MTDQTDIARDPVRIALESIENRRDGGPGRVGLAVLFDAATDPTLRPRRSPVFTDSIIQTESSILTDGLVPGGALAGGSLTDRTAADRSTCHRAARPFADPVRPSQAFAASACEGSPSTADLDAVTRFQPSAALRAVRHVRPTKTAVCCLIGPNNDPLVPIVATRLRERGVRSFALDGRALAGVPLSVAESGAVRVHGETTGAIVFRSRFDAHVGAGWRSALNADGMLAVNRCPPDAFFEHSGWPTWRSALIDAGISVSPIWPNGYNVDAVEAGHWLPFVLGPCDATAGRQARAIVGADQPEAADRAWTCVGGYPILPGAPDNVRAAARVLHHCGASLARITCDAADRVLTVDPCPRFDGNDHESDLAAVALSELIHSHLMQQLR